jgi:anti-anti-sigma factor
MAVNGNLVDRGGLAIAVESMISSASSQESDRVPPPAGRSHLRLRVIERLAVVRFADCEFLVGEPIVREVIGQLEHLVKTDGHSRLLLNLGGVRYLSSEMLAALVDFHRKVDRRGVRIQLCGLDHLTRDLLRTSCLDHLFDICADEAEALGILIR